MSTTPTAVPTPTPAPAGLSEGARLTNVFFAPSETFTDLNRNASWWAPWLLNAVFTVLFIVTMGAKIGWPTLMENQIKMNPKAQAQIEQLSPEQRDQRMRLGGAVTKGISYASPVIFLIICVIMAGLFMATCNFMLGAEISFGKALAVVVYASLVGIVKAVLGIATLLAGVSPEGYLMQNPVATNPGWFLNPTESARWMYSLLSNIDVITIWSLLLMGIGLSCVSKLKKSQTFAVVFGWWILYVLITTGLALAFGS